MTGFAKFLERRRRATARDYDKALCQGQRADFAFVMVRGGES